MGAINPPNKRRERQIALALQDRIAAKMERDLGRVLTRTYQQAANALKTSGTQGMDAAVEANSTELRRALTTGMVASASAFIQRTIASAQKADGTLLVNKASRQEEINAEVGAFIRELVAERVVQIDTTTKEQLKRLVERGLDNQESLPEIADNISNLSSALSGTRAATIARTETHSVSNKAAMVTAETFDLEMLKEWVAVRDDRTRDDHEHANGQQVNMRAKFRIGGDELEYPGDPRGLPENVINCRCAVVFITK